MIEYRLGLEQSGEDTSIGYVCTNKNLKTITKVVDMGNK